MSTRRSPKSVKKRPGPIHKELKIFFPQPTLCQTKRLTTWSLKTIHKNAIHKKTFTINSRGQSKLHLICRGRLLSAHHGGAGRRCYGATCLTWNRSIRKRRVRSRATSRELKRKSVYKACGCVYKNFPSAWLRNSSCRPPRSPTTRLP